MLKELKVLASEEWANAVFGYKSSSPIYKLCLYNPIVSMASAVIAHFHF